MPVDNSAGPEVIASALSAPEGPTVGPGAWILNVCSFGGDGCRTSGGDIVATSTATRESTTVLNTSSPTVAGIPAALAFGPDGALYIADEGHRAVLRVTAQLDVSTFISNHEGTRLNGPNDLSFDEQGNLFFTDPWTSSLENRIGAVYGYAWETGRLTRIQSGLAFPNGIVARGGRLYFAETLTQRIYVSDITGPGQASPGRVFCTLPRMDTSVQGPDGMAFDAEGRLYVAHFGGNGIRVFAPDGTPERTIPTPGANPTNVCFGGAGHRDLFVTVDDTRELIRVENHIVGDRIPFCPTGVLAHPWKAALPDS